MLQWNDIKQNRGQDLTDLLRHLEEFDHHRLHLQKHGGNSRSINRLSDLLKEELYFESPFETRKIALIDQQALRNLLFYEFSLRLDVRENHLGMPLYYICRSPYGGFYDANNLVIEDIYISPDYSLSDERFVKLMTWGHELWYWRLSTFRLAVKKDLQSRKRKKKDAAVDFQVDRVLTEVGGNILGAAWHIDQALAVKAAKYFGLNWFRQAIELLYLILSGRLSKIRVVILHPDILRFFEKHYSNPALHRFLVQLKNDLNGNDISRLPARAGLLYKSMNTAFSSFLKTEIQWGFQNRRINLWQAIFGNYYRLQLVADNLSENGALSRASGELEEKSKEIIETILA